MPLASHGALRATGRKAANAIRSTHPHSTNGQGSGGTGARALHIPVPTHGHQLSFGQTIIHTLEQIRPRTPPNKLFSSTRSFVTNIFTKLSAPGIRVPANIPHRAAEAGSRSLSTGLARSSIRDGLSLPVRYAIHNKAFGAGTFLPRAPFAPRPPIATQVGLGTARNFSTGRPIFQNIVDNVPIALRSLYEADLDVDFARKKVGAKRPLYTALNKPKGIQKMKAKANKPTLAVKKVEAEKENTTVVVVENPAAELERYFRAPTPPAVTTLVFIPLAPTPTNRLPLSTRDALPSSRRPGSFIPYHEVGALHASHNTHSLRVSTLFARLDAANVWNHPGVTCSAYSGNPRKVTRLNDEEDLTDEEWEGVCTFLKLEFAGWTLAEVRGVIGESGQGWCVFEEVWKDDLNEDDRGMLSDAEEDDEGLSSELGSQSSSVFSPQVRSTNLDSGVQSPVMDPSQSFVMPTLDFSSSFLGQSAFAAVERSSETLRSPKTFECDDPWVEDGYSSSGSSGSDGVMSRSSSSGSLGLIIDPPSENGWFASASSRFESRMIASRSVVSHDEEPRERMF